MTDPHKNESENNEMNQEAEVLEPETSGQEISNEEPQADKAAELQAEVEKYKDLYIRAQAEMENLRRRTQQELEKRSKFAVSSFAQDLLLVNDNLSRAMASIPEDKKDEQSDLVKNLLIGLELTQKDLNTALEKNKVTPIESIGRVFDPNLHKVVQEIDDPTKPVGTIVQEWQKGYMIGGDRVLREAVVIVTKGGPLPGQNSDEVHVDTTV